MAATRASLVRRYWRLLDQRRAREQAGEPTDDVTGEITELVGALHDMGLNEPDKET